MRGEEALARRKAALWLAPRTVKEVSADYNKPLPGGDTMGPLIEYGSGEDFGPRTFGEPRQRVTRMGDSGLEATVEDGWHRLDVASGSRAHAFSVEEDAKRQAKTIFATHDERRGARRPERAGRRAAGGPRGGPDRPADPRGPEDAAGRVPG